MSDYPVIQVDGVVESTDYAAIGSLPKGVKTVTFTSTLNPYAKKSIYKLVQICTLVLLRTPGKDIFSPSVGGGLKTVAFKPMGQSLLTVRRGEISVAVAATEQQVLESQVETSLPPEERLQAFSLLDASYNFDEQEWLVITRVISEAGGAADVLL